MEKSFFPDEKDFEYFLLSKKLKTKILKRYYKSYIIAVPNYKEYKCLFGSGKTPTCYAHSESQWKAYHSGTSLQLNFLSFKKNIKEKYKYLTFCFRYLKYDEKNNFISGHVIVHDYKHNSYSFKFDYNKVVNVYYKIRDKSSAELIKDFDEMFKSDSIIEDIAYQACKLILNNEMIIN